MGAQVDTEKAKSFSQAIWIAISSGLGWGFELFDYTAYIFASTLFAPYFFPAADPATSLLYAFLTASLTFFSRPLGGFIFGHFGDRIGRKTVWFIALLGMGVVSVTMGFLPTYQQVGISATIALIALRLLQGIFINGEMAGGWVITSEQAPSKWRALLGGVVGIGAGMSQVILSAAILVASYFAPGAELAIWGWRIIFWVGILPLLVALAIRWKATESVEWRAKAQHKVEKLPLLTALKENKKFFFIIMLAWAGNTLYTFGSITFLPSYLRLYTVINPASIATVVFVANAFVMVGAPVWGYLSDKTTSRKRFLSIAYLANAIFLYPCMLIFTSGSLALSVLAGMLFGFLSPLPVAVLPAWVTENTSARSRYSVIGTANGLGVAIGGMAPYLVVAYSTIVAPVLATSMVAISGCLLGALIVIFSPADRAKQELK
jgi:MHS family shikimate/dehydroshikimate transporter-like MFS transporter